MTVLNVKGRTTSDFKVFQQASSSINSLVYTDAAQESIEDFSLELSIGDGWSDNYSEANKSLWNICDVLTVRRHGSIVVEVKETIQMPYNRYGVVLPTGSLFLTYGLMVAAAKVEPSFQGKLKLRLFNTTNRSVKLKKGQKLGSIIFFHTESTPISQPISRSSEISTRPINKYQKTINWLSNNKATWIGWLVIIITSSLFSTLLNSAINSMMQ